MQGLVAVTEKVGLVLPAKYWAILALAFMGLFLVGLDQGQTLSAVTGQAAYAQNFLHELFHDVRHVAAFACH